ncbi:hypothetical protein [Halorussus lipolyticus]|uniref:hypothetical protein n=1 Tax=Halorussus lipolyticus TaxID=3034024 RepID=UPI0023E892D4|nr:hypothetical protein [Halorussus sp. DT80]
MARLARLALALAVALVLAGAAPAAGDRTMVGVEGAVTDEQVETIGDKNELDVSNIHFDGSKTEVGIEPATVTRGERGVAQETQTENESVVIETEGFEPDYDPGTVLNRVEELRGLSATQGITLHQYDDEDGAPYDMPDEFGAILPIGAQTLQLYSNATTERRQPLGYAVERQAAVHIYLMDDDDLADYGLTQEVVLAHELVHALQFQHDLLSPSRRELRSQFEYWSTDSRLVTTALVEGDAMWVTEQYLARYDDSNYSVRSYNRSLARSAWPHSVAGTPYYYGYEFYERAGSSPAERSAAIEAPVNSTAELLHPGERVERAEIPAPPEIPDAEQLTRYHADTVGELVVRHSLRMNNLSFARAAKVADGWAGDRMYYYAAAGAKGPATHWLTKWESEAEAREFATAWRSLLETNGARSTGDTLFVPASDHAPGLHYVVRRDGATVRITAAERAETARQLAAAVDSQSENATGAT